MNWFAMESYKRSLTLFLDSFKISRNK